MSGESTRLTGQQLAAVERVLMGSGESVAGPLQATVITTGRSNLTYKLADGVHAWVLRMPPLFGRTPSAHDVAREHRVAVALESTEVPVPRPVTLCEDESVLGAPFVLAEFVPGRSIQSRAELGLIDEHQLAPLTEHLTRVLANLHSVDHRQVGLERFGRPDGYAERQMKRWASQWSLVGAPALNTTAESITRALTSRLPRQQATAVVHGDFRIDNTLLDIGPARRPRVVAVVDWELSTIGDPVADVAMMVAYRNPAFDYIVGTPSAWASPQLPDATRIAEMYETVGGVHLVDFELHLALANYKIAVIAAGIEHRRRSQTSGRLDRAGESVAPFLEAALASLKGVRA